MKPLSIQITDEEARAIALAVDCAKSAAVAAILAGKQLPKSLQRRLENPDAMYMVAHNLLQHIYGMSPADKACSIHFKSDSGRPTSYHFE